MIDVPCLLDEGTKNFLSSIADKTFENICCVEVGCFLGGSLCHFGQKITTKGIKNFYLYAVDNWGFGNISEGHMQMVNREVGYYEQFLDNVKKCGLDSFVEPMRMDSIYAAKHFGRESIDFLFIDGDHTYPYVKEELLEWLPKMKKNSILAGHDYSSSADIRLAAHEILEPKYEIQFTENRDSYYIQIGEGLCQYQ